MVKLAQLRADLKRRANPKHAAILQRFFKTGRSEYGEGDVFVGIKVPVLRKLVREYRELPLRDVVTLLKSRQHEYRLVALLILVAKYERADVAGRKQINDLYLKSTRYVNNWDLVDLTAPNIVGHYLLDRPRGVLYKLARSKKLWERRIAMLATFTFIRRGDFTDALRIADLLIDDEHDLMHKAVGWMLREVGKRSKAAEEKFLQSRYRKMPRTMLRYAIERFPETQRQQYLKGVA